MYAYKNTILSLGQKMILFSVRVTKSRLWQPDGLVAQSEGLSPLLTTRDSGLVSELKKRPQDNV